MQKLMERLFALYATEATVCSGDTEKTVQAFFQSVNSRSWQNLEKIYGPLGRIPRGQYICILPAGTACVDDTLVIGGRSYRICRIEDMTVRSETVYQWGLCNEKGGDDTWGLAN